MSLGKDSFIFYRSFYEAIKDIPPEEQAAVFRAICEYALNGKKPKIKGTASGMFKLIVPQIDANNVRYENGKKGGRPSKIKGSEENLTKTEPKPKHNLTVTEPKPNVNVNENVNVNDNENVNVCVEETSHTKPKTHTIPTPDEVIQTAFQIGHVMSREEAQRFIDYNAARGWKVQWKYGLVRWFDHIDEKQKEQENRWGNDPDQRKEYGGEIDWGY